MNDATSYYEFAGHRLDPARRQLLPRRKAGGLFPRCFDALLLLVEHRGELLDKDFLLQALWPEVVVDENSLAKVVSDIRRALGEGARDRAASRPCPGAAIDSSRMLESCETVAAHAGDEPVAIAKESAPWPCCRLNFLNPAAGDEILSLGLADALITRLGQLRHTVVRPTSSIARYAGATCSPAQAGRELGVDAVITGSIRRAGDTLRVSMQLVAVAGDAVAWGEKFDAEGAGALALEDSIAERVATALTLALSRDAPPAARRHRADPDAYEHYIRGRYLMAKRTRASLFEAVAVHGARHRHRSAVRTGIRRAQRCLDPARIARGGLAEPAAARGHAQGARRGREGAGTGRLAVRGARHARPGAVHLRMEAPRRHCRAAASHRAES